MKYQPPSYESGLTARAMYDVMDFLIREYIIRRGLTHAEILSPKQSPLGIRKLWEIPEIKRELGEFVNTYLFGYLQEPLAGFKDIFTGDMNSRHQNLIRYMSNLESVSDSREDAENKIRRLLTEVKRRGDRLIAEISNIEHLAGLMLVKINARDAFANVSAPPYGRFQTTMAKYGLI